MLIAYVTFVKAENIYVELFELEANNIKSHTLNVEIIIEILVIYFPSNANCI